MDMQAQSTQGTPFEVQWNGERSGYNGSKILRESERRTGDSGQDHPLKASDVRGAKPDRE